jgi:hypothetical protein
LVLTPLMPSIETNHPTCDTAGLGPPQSAPPCLQARSPDDDATPVQKGNFQ